MSFRKTQELVEIQNRQFIIKLLPAAESLAVLKELLTRALPIDVFSMIDINGKSVSDSLSNTPLGSLNKNPLSIDEFVQLENRLMRSVYERLAGGDEQIIDEAGNYRVGDLENNLSLYMDLLLKVVSVNYKDFFIEKLKALGLLKETDKMAELTKSFME